ncbi:MAG TPA: nitrate ABC transporter, permease protein, partial [Burkholderiales bacterium]|nr:nitrate ABC transporter, permease protein [Burkholderiales bacterium]
MPAVALRKEISPPKASPPLPSVTPKKFDTGYRRAVAPAWTIEAVACIAGLLLFVAAWAAIAKFGGRIPDPVTVGAAAAKIFADPFYSKGPNDQGIGWNILFSLQRVAVGFGLAALVGIPMGFMIGRFTFLNNMVSPLISL